MTSRLLRTAGEKRGCPRTARVTLGESRHGRRDDVSTTDVTPGFSVIKTVILPLEYFVNLNDFICLFDCQFFRLYLYHTLNFLFTGLYANSQFRWHTS